MVTDPAGPRFKARARELGRIAPGYLADAIAIPFKGSASDVFEAIVQQQRTDQMDDGKWTNIEVRSVNQRF